MLLLTKHDCRGFRCYPICKPGTTLSMRSEEQYTAVGSPSIHHDLTFVGALRFDEFSGGYLSSRTMMCLTTGCKTPTFRHCTLSSCVSCFAGAGEYIASNCRGVARDDQENARYSPSSFPARLSSFEESLFHPAQCDGERYRGASQYISSSD